jgi:hypothetical protein
MVCCSVISKDNLLIPDMHNQITVPIFIAHFACYRDKVLPITKERETTEDTRTRGISTRNFDDLDMPA